MKALVIEVPETIAGLKQLLAKDYDLSTSLSALKDSIRKSGHERVRRRIEGERKASGEDQPSKLMRSIAISAKLTSTEQLDELIQKLHEIKSQSASYGGIELTIEIKE